MGRCRGLTDAAPDFEEELRKIHRLYEDGSLTEEEYQREKREILDES